MNSKQTCFPGFFGSVVDKPVNIRIFTCPFVILLVFWTEIPVLFAADFGACFTMLADTRSQEYSTWASGHEHVSQMEFFTGQNKKFQIPIQR